MSSRSSRTSRTLQLLREVTDNIRAMIVAEEMPADIVEAIKDAYAELGNKMHVDDPFVAVRSSATAEDLPDASFAGQQDTYLNVHGPDMVVQKIKECYASTFTDRCHLLSREDGFVNLSIALSATVQMMVFSKAAGVMFSLDVTNGQRQGRHHRGFLRSGRDGRAGRRHARQFRR